jgi:hypothetical protein
MTPQDPTWTFCKSFHGLNETAEADSLGLGLGRKFPFFRESFCEIFVTKIQNFRESYRKNFLQKLRDKKVLQQ